MKNEMVDSPLFGKTKLPTEADTQRLTEECQALPIGFFQVLNKFMNKRGLCLSISTLAEERT